MKKHTPPITAVMLFHILFHPDYTVGLGITPNLLTPVFWKQGPLAGS